MLGRGVVMAGQRRPQTARGGHRPRLMRRAVPGLQRLFLRDMGQEFRLAQPVFLAHIVAQLREVAKLPRPGGVIHQADNAHPILGAEFRQLIEQRFRTDLGAQMQVMRDPEPVARPHLQDFIGQSPGIFAIVRAVAGRPDRAHPQRVEDRCDAHRTQLRIMGDDRIGMRPGDLRARLDMSLQIVGVQLDQPRRQQIALAIQRAFGHRAARADLGDQPVAQQQMPGPHPLGQNQHGIGQNRLGHPNLRSFGLQAGVWQASVTLR